MAGIKGQAAVTDALFFLVIVMGLVSFLFFFTSQYGKTVGDYAVSSYASDYATSALKTVLYSSFSRNDYDLLEPEAEVDFLVAALKEDYASDKKIDYFRMEFTSAVDSVMRPARNSFDYFILIRIETSRTASLDPNNPNRQQAYVFPYFYLSRKEFTSVYDSTGVFVESVEVTDKNYFCEVTNQSDIDKFIVFVGAQGQAVSPISFPLISDNERSADEGSVQLVLWNSQNFTEEEETFVALTCTLTQQET
ncbi:hypothetical protein KKG83_03970 [Candidatus Micrarchaeota archaeon]|nr:hypothetical protein [Candidatus Micrarchaeota archaeon]MBU2476602.1 hypothetical protein [Candidatus Micrarchaeota archaeon]